jgi:DNA-binding transcriptional MerR regulator
MAERILTLFGEEIIPDAPRQEARGRVKKEQSAATAAEPSGYAASDTVDTPPVGASPGGEPTADVPEPVVTESEPDILAVLRKGKNIKKAGNAAEGKEPEKDFELPEDWKGDKKYYTIGEVAEIFKVKTSHIRFWTNEFKLKVRTTGKGDRLFTADQIRELRAIHHLVKERGFTLSGAKAKLKAQNKMDVETVDLKESLKQLRNKLLIIRNQLI